MKSSSIALIVACFSFGHCFAQSISDSEMRPVRNTETMSYKYKDSLMGCNFDFNCFGFDIIFKDVSYVRKSGRLSFSGTVFWRSVDRPLPKVLIFVAKPSNGILKDLQTIVSYPREGRYQIISVWHG